MGLLLEYFDGNRGIELTVGTWAFRDVSLSLVAKRYVGAKAVRPFVGAGLWVVAANPSDGRLGIATVLRAPVGVDWNLMGAHSLGSSFNVNRAFWCGAPTPKTTNCSRAVGSPYRVSTTGTIRADTGTVRYALSQSSA